MTGRDSFNKELLKLFSDRNVRTIHSSSKVNTNNPFEALHIDPGVLDESNDSDERILTSVI